MQNLHLDPTPDRIVFMVTRIAYPRRLHSWEPNPSFKGEAQRHGTLATKRRGLWPHFALAVQRATPSGSPLTQTLGRIEHVRRTPCCA
jgi:hypothetical protein